MQRVGHTTRAQVLRDHRRAGLVPPRRRLQDCLDIGGTRDRSDVHRGEFKGALEGCVIHELGVTDLCPQRRCRPHQPVIPLPRAWVEQLLAP